MNSFSVTNGTGRNKKQYKNRTSDLLFLILLFNTNEGALVISGGGSRGAFAGGVAEYLIDQLGYKYDIWVGTSTGSLLLCHLALDKVEKLNKSLPPLFKMIFLASTHSSSDRMAIPTKLKSITSMSYVNLF